MSASVWQPGASSIAVNAENASLIQAFVATAGQTTFTLTNFTYVVGTGSIRVYRNGVKLQASEVVEVDSTHFTLPSLVLVTGEVIECSAVLGSQDAVTAAAISAAASASAAAASAASIDTSRIVGKNILINGDMKIDQYGGYVGSVAANTVKYGGLDRWFVLSDTTINMSLSRQNTSLQGSAYGFRMQRASGQLAANVTLAQQVETMNLLHLQGKKATLSFKARCGANYSASPSRLLALVATGSGQDEAAIGAMNGAWAGWAHSLVQPATLTTSWASFSYTFDVPASTLELQVKFNAVFLGTAGAEDWIQVTDVQLEEGSIATVYDRQNIAEQLAECKRYYQLVQARESVWINSTDFYDRGCNGFVVQMRASAGLTATVYAQNSGTINCVRYYGGNSDIPVTSILVNTQGIQFMQTTGGAPAQVAGWYARVSSEFI